MRDSLPSSEGNVHQHHVIIAGALLVLGPVRNALAQPETKAPPLPAPGRLIDVGGWRLHLNCTGTRGGPTPIVILESGAGDFSVDWSLVQPDIARFARVCSYDRAGSGWSDLGPRPRTMHQIAYELHTLLGKGGEPPPYVLVGHSYGGALVRVYQSMYPAEVVGMVLVEAMSDDPRRLTADGRVVSASELPATKTVPPVRMSDPLKESEIPARIVQLIEGQIPEYSAHANDRPRDKLPLDAQRMRTWSTAQLKMAISNDNPFDAEELALLRAERSGKDHVLGDMPLVVLSRGVAEDSGAAGRSAADYHSREQAGLATLSTIGKQVIATHSGHHVPLDEPQLVVSAVREIVAGARR